MDFRKKQTPHIPLTINGSTVESVKSTKFLGVHITDDLTWTTNTTSIVKKAQQCLHFLRRMRRADLPPSALTTFYRGAIESILTSSLSVWYGSCSAADKKALQRAVRTVEKITRSPQPAIQDLYLSHCNKQPISSKTSPTQHTNCSPSSHLESATAACGAKLLDSKTAFSLRPPDYSTHSRKYHDHYTKTN